MRVCVQQHRVSRVSTGAFPLHPAHRSRHVQVLWLQAQNCGWRIARVDRRLPGPSPLLPSAARARKLRVQGFSPPAVQRAWEEGVWGGSTGSAVADSAPTRLLAAITVSRRPGAGEAGAKVGRHKVRTHGQRSGLHKALNEKECTCKARNRQECMRSFLVVQ